CQSRCRRPRRGARSGQKEVDMNENEQGVSDTSEPGVGPDLGGAASTGSDSGGGGTDGDGVTGGEGAGTSGAAERQAREATPPRSSIPTPSTTPTPRRPARAERLPTHRVREPGGHPGPDAVRSSPVRTPASALI